MNYYFTLNDQTLPNLNTCSKFHLYNYRSRYNIPLNIYIYIPPNQIRGAKFPPQCRGYDTVQLEIYFEVILAFGQFEKKI